jgi:hypothetical protein
MKALNLPTYSFKIKSEGGIDYIYDSFRKKYVRLTHEEWVRQNFAQYLVTDRNCPASHMLVERSLKVNKLLRRFDLVVCNDYGEPALIVECKSPDIKIGQGTFEQVSVYNIAFRVKYLIITNGMEHFCCRVDFKEGNVSFLSEIPHYDLLRTSDPH